MKSCFIFSMILLLVLVQTGFGQTPGGQDAIDSGKHYKYLLYLPKEYGESNQLWPLMFFLHGAGERGSDMSKVTVHGPPKMVASKRISIHYFGEEGFQFILVSPQCPAGEWWLNQYLIEILNEAIENYNVDRNRIYCTGISMGGFGTWSLASEYPELFAAIVPICGGGDAMNWPSIKSYTQLDIPASTIENLAGIPVWAFHGESDTTVSITESEKMVDAVNALGGNAQLTRYPNTGHDSWTKTYNDTELYDWFLSHTKGVTFCADWELY